ncbi:TolB family protein [Sphaerospermopsis aphanizomenoides BCCUSP55]|uniref:TolB family protein n=1 Tax=Sphaerospermopsis aphanizomenoides TaxID=459663 RepID=UPI0019059665|nr:PD40 domain-containing protein [Sphaerospermopsis aphanizomenoides]MBK1988079.1 TolB family protein [Sphaerospermopsis aphanizomenoides BCCUSP55]
MKTFTSIYWLQRPIRWSLVFSLTSLLVSCGSGEIPLGVSSLNSRYTEEQPALSGNGRFLAFVSNRNGNQLLLMYDLQTQSFISTPGLNRRETIAESPSLSYTGRYICYITSDQGRPVIALYDRAMQQSQILTPTYRGWVRNPQISPDGRYVVFESAGRGQWDVEVLDRGPTVELDIPNGSTVSN